MPIKKKDAIGRSTLVDRIVSKLFDDIREGSYAPGDALPPERTLASAYGVTRASLKNALVRLESLGLIRTRHGVGSIVQDVDETGNIDLLKYIVSPDSPPDKTVVGHIFEARTMLVGSFARLASQRRTEKDLKALNGWLEKIRDEASDKNEVQRAEFEFMRSLAKASKNRAFIFLTNSIATAYWLHKDFYAAQCEPREWLAQQLAYIYVAIKDRDEEAARMATEMYSTQASIKILEANKKSRKRKKTKNKRSSK